MSKIVELWKYAAYASKYRVIILSGTFKILESSIQHEIQASTEPQKPGSQPDQVVSRVLDSHGSLLNMKMAGRLQSVTGCGYSGSMRRIKRSVLLSLLA